MNGVNSAIRAGLPATAVFRLTANRPISPRHAGSSPRQAGSDKGDEALLAAVRYPPRVGEARALAELMPQVLALHGLAAMSNPPGQRSNEPCALDVLA